MKLLITRPEPLATTTAARLTKAGHSVISDPCQIVSKVEAELQPAEGYIVTSQNAVDYGLKHIADKGAVIFAVGDKTAQAAEDLGFETIFAADGDSESLTELILGRWLNDYGKLLHLSGSEIVTDISALLTTLGYKAERAIVYQTTAQQMPGDITINALKKGEIDAILFYSALSATIFNGWVEETGLAGSLETIEALTLSTRIADQLGNGWKSIKIADEKHEDALIELLKGEK